MFSTVADSVLFVCVAAALALQVTAAATAPLTRRLSRGRSLGSAWRATDEAMNALTEAAWRQGAAVVG
jgi:hypothetical protein